MVELLLLGGGGHARSLLAALQLTGASVRGYLSPRPGDLPEGCPYLGDDDLLADLDPEAVRFVNALGSTASTRARRGLYERAVAFGIQPERVIHPHAFIDPGARLGCGAQIMAGAIVNTGAQVGDDVLLNSGAVIEHDVVVGAHSHIAPGAVVAGDVHLGEGVHVGLGARIIQGVVVGSGSVVGAGAVVITDVPAGATVLGVPARSVRVEEEHG